MRARAIPALAQLASGGRGARRTEVVSGRYGRGSSGGSGRSDGDHASFGPNSSCSARREGGPGATVRCAGGQ